MTEIDSEEDTSERITTGLPGYVKSIHSLTLWAYDEATKMKESHYQELADPEVFWRTAARLIDAAVAIEEEAERRGTLPPPEPDHLTPEERKFVETLWPWARRINEKYKEEMHVRIASAKYWQKHWNKRKAK